MITAILLFLIIINLAHIMTNLFSINLNYENILILINSLLIIAVLLLNKYKKNRLKKTSKRLFLFQRMLVKLTPKP